MLLNRQKGKKEFFKRNFISTSFIDENFFSRVQEEEAGMEMVEETDEEQETEETNQYDGCCVII